MNYKNWKENNLAPAKLTLDKLNPRLPDMGKSPSEINIIQELVENDKVYELAQSITKNGDGQTKVRDYEKQIDQLVYKLYALTPEEIKIVENNLIDTM